MRIMPAIREIADILASADYRVVLEHRAINPPCVLVIPSRVDTFTLCGGELQASVIPIVPGTSELQDYELLDQVLGGILYALDLHVGHDSIEPASIGPGTTAQPLPALEIRVRTETGD